MLRAVLTNFVYVVNESPRSPCVCVHIPKQARTHIFTHTHTKNVRTARPGQRSQCGSPMSQHSGVYVYVRVHRHERNTRTYTPADVSNARRALCRRQPQRRRRRIVAFRQTSTLAQMLRHASQCMDIHIGGIDAQSADSKVVHTD